MTTNTIKDHEASSRAIRSASHESPNEQHAKLGMLVIGPPMRLVHMNQHAGRLIEQIVAADDQHGHSKGTQRSIPASLQQVCNDLFRHLRNSSAAQDWERCEITRLLDIPENPLLVRGFGVPDGTGRGAGRAILLLEETRAQSETVHEDLGARFHLTVRERAVIKYLCKGMTNNEIGSELNLALPTVKEHIRHIMTKTKTSTRTGILLQFVRM